MDTFYSNPDFHIDDYVKGPSGWLSFNQFFARQIKSGLRPIDDICNEQVIVSPTDSIFMGQWNIDDNSKVFIKDREYSINELLNNSPYAEKFKGGIFCHMLLKQTFYHRYHVPASGVAREIRRVKGFVNMDVVKDKKGKLHIIAGNGFQFSEARAVFMLESPYGFIGIIPVGMGDFSSCNFTTEENFKLFKGDEFGYFTLGGSDIVLLFPKDTVKITAKKGKRYNQGEKIGYFIKSKSSINGKQ